MTNFEQSAFGDQPANIPDHPNGDRAAWGGHGWPDGVPEHLLATFTVGRQRVTVTTRREVQRFWTLVNLICEEKHGYEWRAGECHSYQNRRIDGTQRASGHSFGLAIDINAPANPFSLRWVSDMPPAMVADLESLLMYWGGRYRNQEFDPMHFTPAFGPGQVAEMEAAAERILGGRDEEDDMPQFLVARHNGVDYAYDHRTFFPIVSEQQYDKLFDGRLIVVPHGQAQVVDDALIGFIQGEARRGQAGQQPRVVASL